MNDERTHILQMLANGKITVDEAQTLLEAINDSKKVDESFPAPPSPPRAPRPPARRHRRREPDNLIDQVLQLRIHGIDGRFIAEMNEMGITGLTPDELVELKIHGVSPGFIEEVRRAGFEEVTAEELVSMRIHDVDSDFIREMREVTSRDLTVDQLVALRIHDVNADIFNEILNLGVIDVEAEPKSADAAGGEKAAV